jgi:DNA-binding response OmpR family regulator
MTIANFSAIKSTDYEIIILDINLPDKSGIEILQIMRSLKNYTPVLILTALNSAMQKVNGLDAGADDYLTKPFDLSELLARIRSLTRRRKSIMFNNVLQNKNNYFLRYEIAYRRKFSNPFDEFRNKLWLGLKISINFHFLANII